MSASITVSELPATRFEEWDELVARSPDGSIYASSRYLDALCRAAGGSFRILGAWKGQELLGGLPLYERAARGGKFVAPRLLLYYLGPVLRRSPTKYPSQQTSNQIQLLGALADAVLKAGYGMVSLRLRHTLPDVRPFLDRGFTVHPGYSYLVPIGDLPEQWKRVEQNLRRLVERCGSEGVVLTENDDFAAFLRLHHLTMAHHDAAVYLPDASFRRWFELLHPHGLCRLFHAALPSGQVIASQLVLLGSHPVCHTVSAGTDPAHRALGGSAFLRWKAFEVLAAAGKTHTDLTDASLNPVTHFKSQLGGELVVNMLVDSPQSTIWRVGGFLETGMGSVRSKAGGLVRKVLSRGRE